MHELTFSIIEIFISLVVETIILGGLFTWVANKSSAKMEQKLQSELMKVENQNKLIFQEITKQSTQHRNDIINQVKESEAKKNEH